ncbi:MAG: hypothetical protein IPP84_02515 [Propionivibrio sp.]|nr:hypothetical protein [Propionivibrio sp.]
MRYEYCFHQVVPQEDFLRGVVQGWLGKTTPISGSSGFVVGFECLTALPCLFMFGPSLLEDSYYGFC